jgi:hypothetical protein
MSAQPLPEDAAAEANDPLWRLLGRVPVPEPDGWFTARTLARCRLSSPGPEKRGGMVWRWALGLTLAVGVASLAIVRNESRPVVDDQQKNVQEAFGIVASLNTDNDSDGSAITPASWQDSSL